MLRDIKAQQSGRMNKRDKVLAILDRFQASWNWCEVDVAKCLLAGQESSKRRSIQQPDVTGQEDELAQVMIALKKTTAAEAATAVVQADPGQALAEAVVNLRHPQRSSKGHFLTKSESECCCGNLCNDS